MRSAIALALVLTCGLSAHAQDKKYTSTDGKFKAAFPGGKVQTDERNAGGLTIHSVSSEQRGRAFVVLYMDLPVAVPEDQIKELFDGTEKGVTMEGDAKLLSSINMTFGPNKLPAREILVKSDDRIMRSVIILHKKRLYMVLAGGPDSFSTNKDVYAFFESFEITK